MERRPRLALSFVIALKHGLDTGRVAAVATQWDGLQTGALCWADSPVCEAARQAARQTHSTLITCAGGMGGATVTQ